MWLVDNGNSAPISAGLRLAGRQKMIAALERLKAQHEESQLPGEMRAFGIAGGGRGLMQFFTSHPPLEQRIDALRAGNV